MNGMHLRCRRMHAQPAYAANGRSWDPVIDLLMAGLPFCTCRLSTLGLATPPPPITAHPVDVLCSL